MKIDNINLINSYLGKDFVKIEKGSILTAKVVDILDEKVLLDLGNGNFITGTTELRFDNLKNSMINFLIKSINDNVIEIRPLLDNIEYKNDVENTSYSELDLAKDLLDLYSIEKKETNIDAIKAMIKFKMPLNMDNVTDTIKYINRLEFLIKSTDNELYKLFDINQDLFNSDVNRLINNKGFHCDSTQKSVENFYKSDKDLVEGLLKEIENIAPENKLTTETIKQVVFLKKADVELSINNIKYIMKLLGKGNIIEDKLNHIIDELIDDSQIDKERLVNLKNSMNSIKIKLDHTDKELVTTYYKKIKSVLEILNKEISDKGLPKELNNNIDELNSIIKLVNKINENLTFLYIPFSMNENSLQNTLYVMNKNRKSNLMKTDKISVFISLNTKNLSTVEIMCVVFNESININFKVEEQFEDLLDEHKTNLIKTLKLNGFSIVNVSINKSDKNDILDLYMDEEYTNYRLNIKV